MDAETITKRIAELKQLREQLVAEANRSIGEMSGRIAELERLLGELSKDGTGTDTRAARDEATPDAG